MFGITRERDPNLIKLELNVFQQLKNIGEEEDKKVGFVESKHKPTLKILSVEESIKELLEMSK